MTAQEKEGLHLPIKGLGELQAPKRAIRSSFASHSIVGWSRTWDSLALAPLLPDRMPPLDHFLKPALVAEALNYQQTGCVLMCSRSTFIHKPVKTTELGGWVSSCRSRSAPPRQTFRTQLHGWVRLISQGAFGRTASHASRWHWTTVLFEQKRKRV